MVIFSEGCLLISAPLVPTTLVKTMKGEFNSGEELFFVSRGYKNDIRSNDHSPYYFALMLEPDTEPDTHRRFPGKGTMKITESDHESSRKYIEDRVFKFI